MGVFLKRVKELGFIGDEIHEVFVPCESKRGGAMPMPRSPWAGRYPVRGNYTSVHGIEENTSQDVRKVYGN
jgi:hypothetical protein